MTDELKVCAMCKEAKPKIEFSRNAYCKPCKRVYAAEKYQRDKVTKAEKKTPPPNLLYRKWT